MAKMKVVNTFESAQTNLLSLVPAKILADLKTLESAFAKANKSVRLVGGSVRDMLLGKSPKDYDLATTATPEQMLEIGEANQFQTILTGIKHGTVTFVVNNENYEITTLRTESNFTGRHADVEWTTDWEKDAARRDLTINAMSLSLDGTLYDYFDGQKHLQSGQVKFVGNANARIQEDYLRILRYFRFLAKLPNAKFDRETINHINNIEGLSRISGERIWSEIKQIVLLPNARNALYLMTKTHLRDMFNLDRKSITRLFTKIRTQTQNPITLWHAVSRMHADEAETMFKLSNTEKQLYKLLEQYRKNYQLKDLKKMIALKKMSKESAVEIAVGTLHFQDANQLRSWNPPAVPVTGKDLIELGIHSNSELGAKLNLLYYRWAESNFTLSREQLLSSLNTK
jgi:tRNA nucleotidyltransferase (CCA-adding enzyme)